MNCEKTSTWSEDLELFARNTLRLHEPESFEVEVEPWHTDKSDLQVYLVDPEGVHEALNRFLGRSDQCLHSCCYPTERRTH